MAGLGLGLGYGAAAAQDALRLLREEKLKEEALAEARRQQEFENALKLRTAGREDKRLGFEEAQEGRAAQTFRDITQPREALDLRKIEGDIADADTKRAVVKNLSPIQQQQFYTGLPFADLADPAQLRDRAIAGGAAQGAGLRATFEGGQKDVLQSTEDITTGGRLREIDRQGSNQRAAIRLQAELEPPAPRRVLPTERQTLAYYNRIKEAMAEMDAVEGELTAKDLAIFNENVPLPELIGNPALSEAGQIYARALRQYTEARLRKESGAAIPASEYETDRLTVGRRLGDKPETIERKRHSRDITAEGIAYASGGAFEEFYGTPFVPARRGSTSGNTPGNDLPPPPDQTGTWRWDAQRKTWVQR